MGLLAEKRLPDWVYKEQIRLLYKNALPANLSVIGMGFLVALILKDAVDQNILLGWYSILLGSALYRLNSYRQYQRSGEQRSMNYYRQRYIFGSLLVGLAWSGMSLFLLISNNILAHYILFIAIVGTTTAAVPVLSALLPAFYVYTLPQILTLAIVMFSWNDQTGITLGVVVIAYAILISVTARNMNQQAAAALLLQGHNQELIEELSSEIEQRKQAQEQLVQHGEVLEELVETRTAQLVSINRNLEKEVDIRRRTEQNLQHLAHHDTLTNLPNRLLLYDRLNHAIERADRGQRMLAVLFMDLDNFKHVNDSLGHAIGDELLRMVGLRLRSCIREEDTLSRLGGDEFVILIEDVGSQDSVAYLAQKLMEELHRPFEIDGKKLFVGTSIGISLFPQDGNQGEELLKNADAAMYRAKNEGRDNFQFYTSELTATAYERLMLEGNLRKAITEQELVIYYQPQICLATGKLAGVEALIRWDHPDLGILSPAKFLPIAEESGLIVPISNWVLEKACKQMVEWKSAGMDLERIAVNLSGKQIRQGDLEEKVQAALRNSGCQPEWLELEITENFIMQQAEHAIRTLDHLRSVGIHLSIDDFGTGYSSLSQLKALPINRLKIDRSFIRDLVEDPNDAAIVEAIIAMGKRLDLEIIAEGVESQRQEAFLIEQGCCMVQGFYYGRPMPAKAIPGFCRQLSRAC